MPAEDPGVRRWLRAGAIALGFAGLTAWLLAPLTLSPATVTYDPERFLSAYLGQADILLNAWILAWGTHALSGGRLSHFFDANIFHPEPSALAYSEHLIGAQPLFGPLYLATDDLTLAYNLWVLSSFLLCGLAAYWVALRWLGSPLAAALAGIAYAFGPWRFYSLIHTQMLSVQYLPLLAYAVWRTSYRRDAIGWLAICGLAAIQALTGFYVGYVGFFVASALAAASLIVRPGSRARRLLFVASALVVAGLLMLPMSWPYLELERGAVYGGRSLVYSPWNVLVSWTFPPFVTPDGGDWGAWRLLPWLAAVGAGVGLATRRLRALAAALALLAVLGAVVAMGPMAACAGVRIGRVHDLALAVVPGWAGLRVWERFGIAAWLSLCMLAAVPFAGFLAWPRWLRYARVPLALAFLAAWLAASQRVEIATRASPLKEGDLSLVDWLAEHGHGDPVLRMPRQPWNRMYEVEAMMQSTRHWLPLVNGYSGYFPPSYELLMSLAIHLPYPQAMQTLKDLNVARWLLVETGDLSYTVWDHVVWKQGGRVRANGPTGRLYELPYQRGRASPLLSPHPDRTLLNTRRSRLPKEALAAEIVPLRREIQMSPDTISTWVDLRVTNRSGARWPAVAVDTDGLVGVTLRVRNASDLAARTFGHFYRLPADIDPGVQSVARVLVGNPGPGRYRIVPCLEQFGRGLSRCFDEAAVDFVVLGAKEGT